MPVMFLQEQVLSPTEVTGVVSLAALMVMSQTGLLYYVLKSANDKDRATRETLDKMAAALHAAVDALKERVR